MKLGKPAGDLIPDGLKTLRQMNKSLSPNGGGYSKNPDVPLDPREQRFVWFMVEKGLPIHVAFREAGYAGGESTARAKACQPKIKKAMAELKAKFAENAGISRQRVIDGFLDAINVAKIVGEPIAMVAGWREVARVCGLYDKDVKKLDITVNGQVQLEKLQAIPREQLLAIAEGREIEGEFKEISDGAAPELDRKLDPAA